MEQNAGSCFFWRVLSRLRSRTALARTLVFSIVATTVVTFSFSNSAAADTARSVSDSRNPVLIADDIGITAHELDESSDAFKLANFTDIADIVMTQNRYTYVATSTTLQRMLPNGTFDSTFALTGVLTGFTAITKLAIDENSERIYVLDYPTDQEPTVISVDLKGEVMAVAPVTDAQTLVANHGYVAVVTSSSENSKLFSTDFATSTNLNGVSDATEVRVGGLTAGVGYVFRVIPVNVAGQGDPSMPSNEVTPAAPAVVVSETPGAQVPTATPISGKTSKTPRSTGSGNIVDQDIDGDGIDDSIDDDIDVPDSQDGGSTDDSGSDGDQSGNIAGEDSGSGRLPYRAMFALLLLALIALAGLGFAVRFRRKTL